MKYLTESLWIAFGAAIGANARYWIGFFAKTAQQPFPWPTLSINLIGSFVLGAFSAVALTRGWGGHARLFVAVGLCGGFTTFSTFSHEVLDLYFEKSWKPALLYALASVVLCVGGCLLGGHLGRTFFAPHGAAVGEGGNPLR